MSYYLAINIGPIGLTLSMARKPREFWQASYLFSHLMKCLLDSFSQESRMTLLSPQIKEEDNKEVSTSSCKIKAGIYPDRAFFKSATPIADEIVSQRITKGLDKFAEDICFPQGIEYTKKIVRDYFHVMTASCDSGTDREAVSQLNKWLNGLELSVHAPQPGTVDEIALLLQKKFDSPLFRLAFGEKRFEVETLEDIAAYEIKALGASPKTYHKYICIVQADGDGMGEVVTHLPDGELTKISGQLASFGRQACQTIAEYGGMPIYAGGDDLLFIAPVWGEKEQRRSIFDLMDTLDTYYINTVSKPVEALGMKNDKEKAIVTNMSFGLSVTYAKFPLYEAWQYAADQLFGKAKRNWEQKHALAWKLQKHSGSGFEGDLTREDAELYKAFKELLCIPAPERIVSAVAHKLRANEGLLALLEDKTDAEYSKRLDAFFKEVIDIEGKDDTALLYLEQVKNLLKETRKSLKHKKQSSSQPDETPAARLVSTVYGMLRTAKFFIGEEEKL